jgi:hypothetical protein
VTVSPSLSVTSKKDRFPPLPQSESQLDWHRQKHLHGARNDAIDELMEMIGLETVKSKVLALKDKIDLAMRQGTSLKDERLNVAMLGNPGTGLQDRLNFDIEANNISFKARRLSRDCLRNSCPPLAFSRALISSKQQVHT